TPALQGALLTIRNEADTANTATKVGVVDGRAYSYFDVFTMRVDITERPHAAPDILGLTTTNDPILGNTFPPSLDHDDFVFDSRSFHGVLGNLELDVDIFGIDFGSQSFFPGMQPVTDLGAFESLVGTSLASLPYGGVTVASGPNVEYDLVGTQIMVLPEPGLMGLMIFGLAAFRPMLRGNVMTPHGWRHLSRSRQASHVS
ncbi:MAG TPA: hypothetical protein VIY86_09945, partial [Pirellulaceae bacterium]